MQDEIKSGIKAAMIAKDSVRLTVLRGLLTSFTNELISKGKLPADTLPDDDVMAVLRREVKRRKDSIEQFTAGSRPDLAEDEQAELSILETFLPVQMSRDEIADFAKIKIAEAGDIDATKQAQFVGGIIRELVGKADGATVKSVVDELLK